MNAAQQNHHEMARRRWKMLARALHRNREADGSADDIISVRRVSSFGLINLLPLKSGDDEIWFDYSIRVDQEMFSLKIRHLVQNITPVDLMGFNNTGNICVWPSEEVLAYHAMCNIDAFSEKSVLELGGGMTCLAGLLIAKYTKASVIRLTDGNVSSVDNVQSIICKNGFADSSNVSCSLLQWGKGKYQPIYDIVLAADCLFFDESRTNLVSTMWASLKNNGQALVTAPKRGNTLDKFKNEAEKAGFQCTLLEYYNQQIWDRHLKLKSDTPNYDQDIHYPLLLHLMKPGLN